MIEPFQQIFQLARPYLDTRDNEIHTIVAASFANKLLRVEGGDASVVIPAIMLHDVGWKSVPEDLHLQAFGPGENDESIKRIHEVEGAKIARGILDRVRYPPELVDEIWGIIEAHDTRREALSLNDAIVKDSDKLWRLSEEALKIDPLRFKIEPVVHLKWLGRQITSWFLTSTARELAVQEYRARGASFGISPEELEENLRVNQAK